MEDAEEEKADAEGGRGAPCPVGVCRRCGSEGRDRDPCELAYTAEDTPATVAWEPPRRIDGSTRGGEEACFVARDSEMDSPAELSVLVSPSFWP